MRIDGAGGWVQGVCMGAAPGGEPRSGAELRFRAELSSAWPNYGSGRALLWEGAGSACKIRPGVVAGSLGVVGDVVSVGCCGRASDGVVAGCGEGLMRTGKVSRPATCKGSLPVARVSPMAAATSSPEHGASARMLVGDRIRPFLLSRK